MGITWLLTVPDQSEFQIDDQKMCHQIGDKNVVTNLITISWNHQIWIWSAVAVGDDFRGQVVQQMVELRGQKKKG